MKETLEEAAEYHVKMQYPMGVEKEYPINDFIQGANYQAERMYSEEEVRDLILKFNNDKPGIFDASEWFEQFKKK
jgi:hypothetical protein